ncbi:MAG: S9 family peptidase [Bacteroidales bacterium]|nr:S9 family peptidase [Bacteroidales bacterium]MBN2819438.1 S9 family peptidase [Bacteroidales bacterium]
MKIKAIQFLTITTIMLSACKKESEKFPTIELNYVETKADRVFDDYFGVKIADPYRWLEDDRSAETMEWVKKQNEVTFGYLEKIPFRETVRKRLDELSNYERFGIPFRKGNKYYYFKNTGLQNQSVMYVTRDKSVEGEVFLDPNTFSEDGSTALGTMKFTEDGSLVAYTISPGGADWQNLVVMNATTKEMLPDTIHDVKFTGISWKGNEGFYYSRYDKPKGATVLTGMTQQHKVYYHKLGTPQKDDKPVFGHKDIQRRYIGAYNFKNCDYLFVDAAESTSGNEIYFRKDDGNSSFKPVIEGFEADNSVLYAKGEEFYVLTNLDAPKKRIAKASFNKPSSKDWEDIIPEKDEVIESASFAGGYIFVEYLKDAASQIIQYDMEGNMIRTVELPTIGTASGFDGEDEDTEVFYSFVSFTFPTTIYSYKIESGESELFRAPEITADLNQYETKQVFYESKDGTKVPMFIVARKGIKPDGSNPTLLYGYGGFNVSYTPSFGQRWFSWLDMGGVFALANIRGGGEYGEAWHEAGTKMKKQNVFDDFIAAAEYLQKENYCSKEKLTILGGSNGGLLVGAVMTQRPDLMQVALPAVGVMDMLRYHKFTAGAGWISDYGCADSSKAMFEYLLAYSPVQNVKEGVEYPATMVTTADHDDRVVPAHSFKFISQLQNKQAGELPVLIRIAVNAGHGGGMATSKYLDELADIYSFAFYNMNEYPVYYQKK